MDAPSNTTIIPVSISDKDKLHFTEMFAAYYKEQKVKLAIDPKDPEHLAQIMWRKAISLCIVQKVGVVLFAKVNNTVAGMLYWIPTPTFATTRQETLTGGVYVKKEFRRQGLCSLMRKVAATVALEQGFTCVTGTVTKGNKLGEAITKNMVVTGVNYQCALKRLV